MSTPFLAEIKIVSFNFAPKGWALCNGQLLPINQNQALFALLGTTFGGNGQTTFGLPNLQSRTPIHTGGGFTLGQAGGEENHTLTPSELPTHGHQASGNTGAPNSGTPAGSSWATLASNAYGTTPNVAMNAASSGPAGGGQLHANMPPYAVLNMVIALQGIFPSRN